MKEMPYMPKRSEQNSPVFMLPTLTWSMAPWSHQKIQEVCLKTPLRPEKKKGRMNLVRSQLSHTSMLLLTLNVSVPFPPVVNIPFSSFQIGVTDGCYTHPRTHTHTHTHTQADALWESASEWIFFAPSSKGSAVLWLMEPNRKEMRPDSHMSACAAVLASIFAKKTKDVTNCTKTSQPFQVNWRLGATISHFSMKVLGSVRVCPGSTVCGVTNEGMDAKQDRWKLGKVETGTSVQKSKRWKVRQEARPRCDSSVHKPEPGGGWRDGRMMDTGMYRWMDGQMEWMDALIEGGREVWTVGWMDGGTDMEGCMKGWMYRCMYLWMDGWRQGWMEGCMDGWTDVCIYGWMYGWWRQGWMVGWMDGLIEGGRDVCADRLMDGPHPSGWVTQESCDGTTVPGLVDGRIDRFHSHHGSSDTSALFFLFFQTSKFGCGPSAKRENAEWKQKKPFSVGKIHSSWWCQCD